MRLALAAGGALLLALLTWLLLRGIDTKAVRAELLVLALTSLLTDAGERVSVLGSGMRLTRWAQLSLNQSWPVSGATASPWG